MITVPSQLYPFDTQRCTMDLELRELERSSILLMPKDVVMESETVLTQYIISKWSLQYKSEGRRPVLESLCD